MFMLPVILAMKLVGFFLSKGIEKVTCMEVSKLGFTGHPEQDVIVLLCIGN